jgi:fatty-acyl-CoA synthase
MTDAQTTALIAQAAMLTVGDLLRTRAQADPQRIAIEQGERQWTYAEFNARVNWLAATLRAQGVVRGDRVAILSENRHEYLELVFAAAKLGAIVAALNWRLAGGELEHCVRLVTPKLAMVSPRYAAVWGRIDSGVESAIELGPDYEARLAASAASEPENVAEPEDGLLILYTSGTTGLPKGALISHRAAIARLQAALLDWNLERDDAFLAWPPMFHMASADQSISTLAVGGKVIIVDGFDVNRILDAVESDAQWWLVLMPGMIEQVITEARRRGVRPKGLKRIGAMADLVPLAQIAEASTLLQAPYANTFGSTETGIPPLSLGVIAPGDVPARLSKWPSALGRIKLVDANDCEVADGAPGELAFRGPTLFSGYWNAHEANTRDFRGGWFHMGDMFARQSDGSYNFVDRVKYMIKSGGENIYPAEIERVLLADPRVSDAIVVRRADAQWGEVPVALVARNDDSLTTEELMQLCRRELAGYKRPKEIRFVRVEELPRSATGKIQRHEVESWLKRQDETGAPAADAAP